MHLTVLKDPLALSRLPAEAALPPWLDRDAGCLVSVTRSADETSIVCPAGWIPPTLQSDHPWRAFKVAGPLDLGLVGILAELSAALAAAGISIFAVSTFDTDYVLVRETQLEAAVAALIGAGHTVSA